MDFKRKTTNSYKTLNNQTILHLDPDTFDRYCPGISKSIYDNCKDKGTFVNCCKDRCALFKNTPAGQVSSCINTTCDNCEDLPFKGESSSGTGKNGVEMFKSCTSNLTCGSANCGDNGISCCQSKCGSDSDSCFQDCTNRMTNFCMCNCTSDTDCKPDQTCIGLTCVNKTPQKECSVNADCNNSNKICSNENKCVNKEPEKECEVSEDCKGDNKICSSNFKCIDDDGGGLSITQIIVIIFSISIFIYFLTRVLRK